MPTLFRIRRSYMTTKGRLPLRFVGFYLWLTSSRVLEVRFSPCPALELQRITFSPRAQAVRDSRS